MSDQTTLTDRLLQNPSPGLKRLLANNDLLFAAGIGMILVTLILPLPTFALDMLLACSLAIGIAVMVTVLSTRESVEFSTFPSLLLFVTLFRLSTNVATTRLILLQGDAGDIIETFGNFVAGGQLVVGLVAVLILVIIQFVVITKGSERISEVAARFNLDAMPGKQMAIDADLNAGLIGEEQAKERREKVARESEFYGAMDGASKFVRGDAIAGLIITGVNLIGGIVLGMTNGLDIKEAIQRYSILAIGDGLVSQVPALIISVSAGFLISKTSTSNNLSEDLTRQFLSRSRPLATAAVLLALMGLIPGFPKIPFFILAGGLYSLSRMLRQQEIKNGLATATGSAKAISAGSSGAGSTTVSTVSNQANPLPGESGSTEEKPIEQMLDVDRLAIHVGAKLIKIVDPRRKGSLSQRIGPLRRKFAQQFGLVLPLVRLRDNVQLENNAYEIRMNNHVIASGEIEPDKLMAMDPGTVMSPIDGLPAEEPVFNLPALWIDASKKDQAEFNGYTVVDPETVMITHLSEILRKHAWELLSRDDVQLLVDRLKESQPALVNGVVGESVSMGLLHRVLQKLLRDSIPICDLGKILESLGDNAPRTNEPELLTELTRKALVRTITEQYVEPGDGLIAITFDPALEYELCNQLIASENSIGQLAPDKAMLLTSKIIESWKSAMEDGHETVVLLCDYRIRSQVAELTMRQIPQLPIVAYDEIALGTPVEAVSTIELELGKNQELAASI